MLRSAIMAMNSNMAKASYEASVQRVGTELTAIHQWLFPIPQGIAQVSCGNGDKVIRVGTEKQFLNKETLRVPTEDESLEIMAFIFASKQLHVPNTERARSVLRTMDKNTIVLTRQGDGNLKEVTVQSLLLS